MKRREFISTTATAVAGLMFGQITAAVARQEKQRRPNILFIMTDQQHAGMMSCVGGTPLRGNPIELQSQAKMNIIR